jgi:hypothetical protein
MLQEESLEKELNKARKHSAMLQSKLDGAFAKYHNEVQEMQGKSNDLIRKNKSLRRKNKSLRQKNEGMPPPAFEYLLRVPYSSLTCVLELLQILKPG